ncbi:hypothetical protein C0989_004638 [Termitomyces sp. Mn162]|nr:hypothetical protein C0989_004638 [Termitomyces sp. Mn162]
MAEWLCYGEVGIFTHLLHHLAEMVRASLAKVEEPFSVVPLLSAAPTEKGPSLSVVLATTNPAMSSIASSQDTPTDKSMELDYANDSLAPTNSHPATIPQVIPSPLDVTIATNIATLATFEAGSSGSNDMANTVSECWADIMSNKEAVAS